MTDSAATKPSPVQLTLTLPQMELLADMFDERFLDLWKKTEFDECDLPPIAFAIHCRKALEASVEAGYPPHIILRTVREVAQFLRRELAGRLSEVAHSPLLTPEQKLEKILLILEIYEVLHEAAPDHSPLPFAGIRFGRSLELLAEPYATDA